MALHAAEGSELSQIVDPICVDVTVVGGGPAGMCAAISAARMGASTLLVEQSGRLGGTTTSGLLSIWAHTDDGQNQVHGGLVDEFLYDLVRVGAAAVPKGQEVQGVDHGMLARDNKRGFIPVNPEALAELADRKASQSGVVLLFHTIICGANVGERRIVSLRAANKAGMMEIRSDIVIDCSGDADVVFFAGGRFQAGEPGVLQPMTTVALLGGVDTEAYLSWRHSTASTFEPQYPELVAEAVRVGVISFDPGLIHSAEAIPAMPGLVAVNFSRIPGNGTDPFQLSNAEIEGRRQAIEIEAFFRRYVPGFSNCFRVCTGTRVGVRETRRILGHYTLNETDMSQKTEFEDSIGRNSYHIDIHKTDGGGHESYFFESGHSYGIPYRCLVPLDLENVVVAGRSISTTRKAQSSIRVTPCCMVTGQAAGTAAAIAARLCLPLIEVPYDNLRDSILQSGGII
jgi:hypothetical protein